MEKWVVSTTLTDPTWNNSEVIAADVASEIARRKAQDGGDIVQYGFGPVTDLLLTHGLLDELRLWVHPFMVGSGTPGDLLVRPERAGHFDLADVTPLTSGIVVLTYNVEGISSGLKITPEVAADRNVQIVPKHAADFVFECYRKMVRPEVGKTLEHWGLAVDRLMGPTDDVPVLRLELHLKVLALGLIILRLPIVFPVQRLDALFESDGIVDLDRQRPDPLPRPFHNLWWWACRRRCRPYFRHAQLPRLGRQLRNCPRYEVCWNLLLRPEAEAEFAAEPEHV